MALLPRSTNPHQTIITPLLLLLCFMNTMSVSLSKAASSSSTTTADHENNRVEKTVMEADEHRTGIKCGSCPCVNPCAQQQFPPPPPPSPPKNCNPTMPLPPPPPRFIYVTGIPGEMYQSSDQNAWQYYYSGAGQNVVQGSCTTLLVVGGLVLQLVLIVVFRS